MIILQKEIGARKILAECGCCLAAGFIGLRGWAEVPSARSAAGACRSL